MEQSESIKELAEALAAAQAELANPGKTGKGNYGRYAELGPTLDLVRPVIGKHGLSVVQLPMILEDGTSGLTTQLMHKSGEWIKSTMPLKMQQTTPQAQGSAITYARRYSLSAMLGVAGDDDDGAEASKGSEPEAKRPAPRPKAPVATSGRQPVAEESKRGAADPATPLQKKRITAALRGKGVLDADMAGVLAEEYGIVATSKMTAGDAESVLEMLS